MPVMQKTKVATVVVRLYKTEPVLDTQDGACDWFSECLGHRNGVLDWAYLMIDKHRIEPQEQNGFWVAALQILFAFDADPETVLKDCFGTKQAREDVQAWEYLTFSGLHLTPSEAWYAINDNGKYEEGSFWN